MIDFVSHEANKKVDVLFFVLMGHGGTIPEEKEREFLLTADGYGFIVIEGLERILDNKKYPLLKDKPKVAIIQQCRGGEHSFCNTLKSAHCRHFHYLP